MKITPMLLAKITHKIALDAVAKDKNVFWAQDGSSRLLKIPEGNDYSVNVNPPAKNGGGDPVKYERTRLILFGSCVDCWVEVPK